MTWTIQIFPELKVKKKKNNNEVFKPEPVYLPHWHQFSQEKWLNHTRGTVIFRSHWLLKLVQLLRKTPDTKRTNVLKWFTKHTIHLSRANRGPGWDFQGEKKSCGTEQVAAVWDWFYHHARNLLTTSTHSFFTLPSSPCALVVAPTGPLCRPRPTNSPSVGGCWGLGCI